MTGSLYDHHITQARGHLAAMAADHEASRSAISAHLAAEREPITTDNQTEREDDE